MQVGSLALSAGDNFAESGGASGGGVQGAANFSSGGGGWGIVFPGSDEAAILAAHPNYDSGIITQGPAEVAYIAPANINEVKLLGVTPAGRILRATRSVIYSAYGAAQYKATANLSAIGVNEQDGTYSGSSAWMPSPNTIIGYGATALEAITSANFAMWQANPAHGWSNGIDRGLKPAFVDTTIINYAGANNQWGTSGVAMTLYYLDTHETITYDFI